MVSGQGLSADTVLEEFRSVRDSIDKKVDALAKEVSQKVGSIEKKLDEEAEARRKEMADFKKNGCDKAAAHLTVQESILRQENKLAEHDKLLAEISKWRERAWGAWWSSRLLILGAFALVVKFWPEIKTWLRALAMS